MKWSSTAPAPPASAPSADRPGEFFCSDPESFGSHYSRCRDARGVLLPQVRFDCVCGQTTRFDRIVSNVRELHSHANTRSLPQFLFNFDRDEILLGYQWNIPLSIGIVR